ncbi:MAG: bifunctional hydroxymethylpyrimidine kinase/phosphomethylpyrimidine kinase [Candidatus Binatia bacterium]
MVPRVLIVAGSDSSGGAGVQADLKTVSALGAFGMTAITALTAQNTTGVFGVLEIPPDFVARQIEACVTDIGCDAVKAGMLSSAPIVEAVAAAIEKLRLAPVVVDPVMISKSGAPLLLPDAVETLRRRLLPLAAVVTPNLAEAGAITGRDVRTLAEMRDAARAIADLGPRNVVVKGGHLRGPAIDLLFDGRGFHELRAERIDTGDTHGTGCIFASAIAAGLAAGRSVEDSVAIAKELVTSAIRSGLRLGAGHGPANPLAAIAPAVRRGS